jgi:hypothetical protein
MVAQLARWAQSHGFKPEEWVRKSGTAVHFKTPINGNPDQGYVQTDFMFLQNVPWSKFVLGAMPADSKYKGQRTQRAHEQHSQEHGLQVESDCRHC